VVVLTLYVAGASVRSERAIANIQQIRDLHLGERCVVQVVDVLERPEQAESAHIMATPTLVREEPKPERRIIGDLSDTQTVLKTLNIVSNGGVGSSV
jgi:circadian clock protein KaiB